MASPLGLTGFTNYGYKSTQNKSIPTLDGVVIEDTSKLTKAEKKRVVYTNVNSGKQTYKSIMNDSRFYYRPKGNSEGYATKSTSVHRPSDADDIYDVSTNSIINYTQKVGHEAMRLKAADFAYLRDLGVYPNNRLIVMRRFTTPVGNDLTTIKHRPIATVVGWVGEDDKSFGINDMVFNEEWTKGEASLTKILSDMFGEKEIGAGAAGGVSSLVKGVKSAVPLPGLTRGFQYKILERMGVRNPSDNLPDGNPNYVQESSMRKVVDSDDNGSGLISDWAVDMTTTYEQKFINGNDPSIVFLDILGNLLRFGTSKSEFFINGKGGELFEDFFKKFEEGKWISAMKIIIGVVSSSIKEIASSITDFFGGGDNTNGEKGEQIEGGFTQFSKNLLGSLGESIISKYKVRIASVIAAWTGSSSAPWHVTIGNPKKPFFSSGDMICSKVKLKFGTVLAFNDLPSTIEVQITLKPARNLGLQEIFERFNTGAGRSYIALSDSFESDAPNRYWSNWWDETPKEPTHTANDGLGADNSKVDIAKIASDKTDKIIEQENKNKEKTDNEQANSAWSRQTTSSGSNKRFK